jgi:hypothetical protein
LVLREAREIEVATDQLKGAGELIPSTDRNPLVMRTGSAATTEGRTVYQPKSSTAGRTCLRELIGFLSLL